MKSKLIVALAVGTMMMSSCSKKLGEFSADYFTVNPSPLEAVAGKVPATVTGNIPAKFFVKNAEVTVTPYLVYAEGETASQAYTLQGEKVRGNNTVIPFENGAVVTIPVSYDYKDAMMRSNLWLDFVVRQGNKTYVLPRVRVAEGVIATSTLADAKSVAPAQAADKFERVINEKVSADIKFLINQTNIRNSELTTDEIKNLEGTLKAAQGDEKREIEEINISSYASPEGGVAINTRIAEGREKNTQTYLDKALKTNGVEDYGNLTADFTPQDWEGFQKLVAESNIQDKQLILSVLSMYKDPAEREREIRNLSSVFDQLLKDVLPKLRYSRLTASINVIGKSDTELKEAFAKDPKTLTVEELLYTATLYNSNDEKMAVYKACTQVYPNDYRGFNNLGLTQYVAGDYKAAESNFKKAAALDTTNGEAKMNLGLIDMLNNNLNSASQKFGAAAGVEGLGDALGTYYVKTGDYNAAVRAFGDTKSNNAALAQILTKDYSKARNTLSSITTPDATTYYLMAVLGARTNNEKMVTSNLRQAVKLDKNMATKARNDMEFAKFNLSAVL